jgi:plastocyanin
MDTISPFKKTLMALTAVTASAVLAGCGNDSKADLVNGKTLFVERCGSCHTLARAGTDSPVGPDLDDAFRQSKHEGMGDTIEGVVRRQIQLPSQDLSTRSLVMPPDLVKGMDSRDVAAYVSFASALPGKDTGALAQAGTPKVPTRVAKADASNRLVIDADPSGATRFDAGKAIAKPGKVTLEMDNPSSAPHNIAVKDGVTKLGPIVSKGGKSIVTVSLKAGTYTFFCSVPGHEQAGMKGELQVK